MPIPTNKELLEKFSKIQSHDTITENLGNNDGANKILNVLQKAGIPQQRIDNIIKYQKSDIASAVSGKPTNFTMGTKMLARNYTEYLEVCVNYDPAKPECTPIGMGGYPVKPYKVDAIEGVPVAFFKFAIDSGD